MSFVLWKINRISMEMENKLLFNAMYSYVNGFVYSGYIFVVFNLASIRSHFILQKPSKARKIRRPFQMKRKREN